MACTLIKYNTPNESALHSRKRFHSSIKDANESVEEWFHRIQKSVNCCGFGALTNVLLIDKFISGLEIHLFGKLSETTTLTVEETLSIAISDELSYTSFESVKTEAIPNVDDFASLELIKNEDEDELAFNQNGESSESEFNEKVSEEPKSNTAFETDENVDIPKTELKGSKLDDKKQTVCLDCGKSFVLRSSYILHRRLHTGENLHTCKICSKPCLTRGKLERHMTTHKDDGRVFECYLCSSTFNQFFALRKHYDAKHFSVKKEVLACTFCDKKFTNPQAFQLHVNVHNGIIDAHKCQRCDKKFDTRARLLIHIRTHSDFREFVCETCGIAYKTKKDLKVHVFRHTGERPYKCECGKSFYVRYTYNNHLRQHTGERPFKCEICDRTFVQRSSMTKHLKIHRKEKPHACSMCPSRFTSSSDLKTHQSVHTGARPFSCDMCDKSFTQSGTLRAHKAKVHPTIANL